MIIRVFKSQRTLVLSQNGVEVFRAAVALGRQPIGPKTREGDGRTPEGLYHICLVKEQGRHGKSLGLDYPSIQDAEAAWKENRIDGSTRSAILAAHREGLRPPWGTPLGGEIYLHGGGAASDWTQGCIALSQEDMEIIYAHRDEIVTVEILP